MAGTRAHRRRGIAEALASAGCLAALLVGLVALDERVKFRLAAFVSRESPGELGAQLRDLSIVALQAVRDHSLEHAPMVMFALMAVVLVFFMLRT